MWRRPLCLPHLASGVFGIIVSIVLPHLAAAQADPGRAAVTSQGVLPAANFEVLFRTFGPPPNRFAPFYSWDAHMALDLTVARWGRSAVEFGSVFQTVGTENLAARIAVGGTGYIIRAAYTRTYSEAFSVSAGVSHLSSHLTRDLDEKTAEQRRLGIPIPDVTDPHEYNVVVVTGVRTFESSRFRPELSVALEPIDFRFDGRRSRHARPLYAATRWTLWQAPARTLTMETRHEIGRRSWNEVALYLSLFGRRPEDARFQLFASASPGRGMHVSPNVGGLRDGLAFGVRLTFKSIS